MPGISQKGFNRVAARLLWLQEEGWRHRGKRMQIGSSVLGGGRVESLSYQSTGQMVCAFPEGNEHSQETERKPSPAYY